MRVCKHGVDITAPEGLCVPSRTQYTYQLIACISNTGDIAVHAKRYICRLAKELYLRLPYV